MMSSQAVAARHRYGPARTRRAVCVWALFVAFAAAAALTSTGCSADTVVVAMNGQPGSVRLGAAPPLAAGQRRLVTGTLSGLETPPGAAVSVEVLLRSGSAQVPVSIGRFSPFPLQRIQPEVPQHHQPFALPTQGVIAPSGGGDWYVEFRLVVDARLAPQSVRAEFSQVAFSSD
jgi:hypothetical protein